MNAEEDAIDQIKKKLSNNMLKSSKRLWERLEVESIVQIRLY